MPLMPGARLGSYEVGALIGEGGMGQVYRARDIRLKREVAIKVLPEAFSRDPDRLARFQREAELLATLNHPNIAAVYGIEKGRAEAGRHMRALVMELVEGETLAEKLEGMGTRGYGLAVDEALKIGAQIADALEAAHERGVIHRDLKPANVKITPDGKVKVLDFGLAKALDPPTDVAQAFRPAGRGSPEGLRYDSPTLTSPAMMTGVGMVLGTAAYMSPEQARGKPVDRRTDIWAFGCVLYEMLTGRKTFDVGETVSDAVAAILTREPDWSALPPQVPAHIRRLLQRCLQRDLQKRQRDIGDVRIAIDEPESESAPSAAGTLHDRSQSRWRSAAPAAVGAVLAAAITSAAWWWCSTGSTS